MRNTAERRQLAKIIAVAADETIPSSFILEEENSMLPMLSSSFEMCCLVRESHGCRSLTPGRLVPRTRKQSSCAARIRRPYRARRSGHTARLVRYCLCVGARRYCTSCHFFGRANAANQHEALPLRVRFQCPDTSGRDQEPSQAGLNQPGVANVERKLRAMGVLIC